MCNLKFARAFEITEECIRETLDICAGETMEVYAYFTQHYLTPPACRNDSHTRDQGEIVHVQLTQTAHPHPPQHTPDQSKICVCSDTILPDPTCVPHRQIACI